MFSRSISLLNRSTRTFATSARTMAPAQLPTLNYGLGVGLYRSLSLFSSRDQASGALEADVAFFARVLGPRPCHQ
jgi:hypothetical protein